MKRKIYFLGNPGVEEDSKPLKITASLKKRFKNFNFIPYDPTEDLPPNTGNFIFMDTVIGIEKVRIFNGLNDWSLSPRNSVHDYDLLLELKLRQKLGRLKKIAIIGIPSKGNVEDLTKQVCIIFRTI